MKRGRASFETESSLITKKKKKKKIIKHDLNV